jgi:hypothetical protein
VGSNTTHGAAYVFYRDQGGPDAWGQVAKLIADADHLEEMFFGMSVSVSGSTAIVGADHATVGSNLFQGSAYIFSRDQGGTDAWGLVAKLAGADSTAYNAFGSGVSISDDIAIVGARGARVGSNIGQGAAYIFYRNQGGANAWGQVAKLIAADGTENDSFGNSVSINNDTALVGAWWANLSEQGAAYIFYRNQGGTDTWGQVAKLVADDGRGLDHFGTSVSISDDVAIIGVPDASVNDHIYQGAAYMYYRHLGGVESWGQAAKLTAADGVVGDCFGKSVSIGEEITFVGAAYADIGDINGQGAVYILTMPPGAADDAYETDEDTTLQVPVELGVLADDVDPQGNPLTAVKDSDPAHGTLDLNPDGSFTYTPIANYFGPDSFDYHANNGEEDSVSATVLITVAAVNDVPVAVSDSYNTPVFWSLFVAGPGVLLNDTDVENDPLTAVLDSGPSHGTLDLNADGSFTYTPGFGFSGIDTFTYHTYDGIAFSNSITVQITIAGYKICLPLVSKNP